MIARTCLPLRGSTIIHVSVKCSIGHATSRDRVSLAMMEQYSISRSRNYSTKHVHKCGNSIDTSTNKLTGTLDLDINLNLNLSLNINLNLSLNINLDPPGRSLAP